MIDRSSLVFIDVETTGLEPERGHEIWELCLGYYDTRELESPWTIEVYRFPVDLHRADPQALAMNGYHLRGSGPGDDPADSAERIVETIGTRTLAGMNVQFDHRMLLAFLSRHAPDLDPKWDYHLLDIEAFVVGYLNPNHPAKTVPWRSADISGAVGVAPEDFERHTAEGDVEWCRAILESVLA